MLERIGCWLISSGTGSVLNPLHPFRLNAFTLSQGNMKGGGAGELPTSNTPTVQHPNH